MKLIEYDLQKIEGYCDIFKKTPQELAQFVNNISYGGDPGNILMGMFYIFSSLNQNDFAQEMQVKAFQYRKLYRLTDPTTVAIKLLVLSGPGGMENNAPIDFIVQNKNIRLDVLFITLDNDSFTEIPDHDVAFIAIGESTPHLPILEKISQLLTHWPKPYINPIDRLYLCRRDRLPKLLINHPNILIPPCLRISREGLENMAIDQPLTIRPIDTHGGLGLEKIGSREELNLYLSQYQETQAFYVSHYVDYQSKDGKFRKYRIALIDKKPYICHLAISDDWIVKYLAAGMHEDSTKRAEEQWVMEHFAEDFAVLHHDALFTIAEVLDLEYIIIDCAQTADGKLLLFEADGGAWIHATDPPDIFPYKAAIMQKAFDAFEQLLIKKINHSKGFTERTP